MFTDLPKISKVVLGAEEACEPRVSPLKTILFPLYETAHKGNEDWALRWGLIAVGPTGQCAKHMIIYIVILLYKLYFISST